MQINPKYNFLINDILGKKDNFVIDYYERRIEQIIIAINSMIDEYTGYFSMNEIEEMKTVLEEVKRYSEEIKAIIQAGSSLTDSLTISYDSMPNDGREKLVVLISKVFEIEDSLVKYNSRIWYQETASQNAILFNTSPVWLDNPKKKGMISCSSVIREN